MEAIKLNDEELDHIFHALSDRSRRAMLMSLSRSQMSISELGGPLGLSKQLVSKHLNVLEKAGLVTKQKQGRLRLCTFNEEAFGKAESLMAQYREFWNQRFDALETYIEKLQEQDDE
jgi:DNA-binding transcriptional ArsR family regulator